MVGQNKQNNCFFFFLVGGGGGGTPKLALGAMNEVCCFVITAVDNVGDIATDKDDADDD